MLLSLTAALLIDSAAQAPACRFMGRPAKAGEVIDISDTSLAPCSSGHAEKKLRYDPVAKVARAAVDLAPGDDLGPVLLPKRPRVLPGERVAVVANLGSVQISKEVTALQAGHSGRWLFVRDDAGQVFKVPMPLVENRP